MKKNLFCLVMALVLCLMGLYVPVLAADDTCAITYQGNALPGANDTYPVSVYSTYNDKTTKETIVAVKTGEKYRCKLKAPNGFILPSSILVKVKDTVLKMNEETTYSYDSQTGEIVFANGVITGEVVIRVEYDAGMLVVGNVILYHEKSVVNHQVNGMSFDPATQTLTLENATITKTYTIFGGRECGIYTNLDHLTIVLEGENTLTMPAPKGNRAYGIYADGDLSIVSADKDKPGKLTIRGADIISTGKSVETCGIFAGMAENEILFDNIMLDIHGGTSISAQNSAASYGLYIDVCEPGYRGLYIKDSAVAITTGDAVGAGAYSAGLYTWDFEESNVTIANSVVSVSGSYVTGSKNVASYGISTGGNIRIQENSKVTCTAGKAETADGTTLSYGVYSASNVSVSDAQLVAQAGTVRFVGEKNGQSTGVYVSGLELKNADFKAIGADTAFVGYRDFMLGQEPWYQWTNAVDKDYVLSRVKTFKREADVTYLHILPVSKTTDKEQLGNTVPMSGQFSDVHPVKHWATNAIDEMAQRNLLAGYQNGTFKPDAPATRSQIVTILWRMDGAPTFGQGKSGTFVDVPEGTWYTQAVEWAAANGITDGKGDGTFGPNDKITREQLAVMLYRYEQYRGGGFSGMWMFLLDYEDRADVSEWAYEAMCWMTMNKVINGSADGTLNPKGIATRAEVAQVLTNYLKLKD